jgi:hypothetical protein
VLDASDEVVTHEADEAAVEWEAGDLREEARRGREGFAEGGEEGAGVEGTVARFVVDGEGVAFEADRGSASEANKGVAGEAFAAFDRFEEEEGLEGRELAESGDGGVEVCRDVEGWFHGVVVA